MNRDARVRSVPAFRPMLTEKTAMRQPGFLAKRAGQKLGRHSEAMEAVRLPQHGQKMELTARQYRALCSICEALLPAAPGWPSAVERGVPQALAAALDFNPRVVHRWEFLNLLDFWDSPVHSFFEVGTFTRFSELPEADKCRV